MPQQAIFSVADPSEVGAIRRAAQRLADVHALSATAAGAVAIVASELATNLSRYATNGRIFLRALPPADGAIIEVLSVDDGPGLDPQRALQDGYSTGGTAGNGLGAVRRLSGEFDLFSAPGSGTVVLARIGEDTERRRRFTWGVAQTAALHETVSGDAWRVAEDAAGLSVLMADGLGHGEQAAIAARAVAGAFDAEPFVAPQLVCERAHLAAQGTRGAAVSAARIAGTTLRYAGVGNIAGTVIEGQKGRGLANQNGTVGLQVRRVQEFEYNWGPGSLLVLHSDGLHHRWALDTYRGLAVRHPSVIAAVLHRDCLRGRDDATVVVVKQPGSAEKMHD